MDSVEIVAVVLSIFLIASGIVTLVLAWIAPALLDAPLLQWLLTGKRLAPTRSNRILVSVWGALFGLYILLAIMEQRLASYIVFAAWLPLAVVVIWRSFRPSAEA